MSKCYYLIGSLRNKEIPVIEKQLREKGIDTFAEWHSAGPEADDWFKHYMDGRNLTYREALKTYAARHIFEFDKAHLDRCDGAILVMPAGKSAHLELGYMAGQGKPTWILFDETPERYDLMSQFANDIAFSVDELVELIKGSEKGRCDTSIYWMTQEDWRRLKCW